MNQSLASFRRPRRVALLASRWHADLVNQATTAALAEFKRQRWPRSSVVCHEVPGAFEIPLHALRWARSGQVDAVIACGLIVNGGIYRHEFVASAVIDGLMRVQLDTNLPVFSAVLTPRDFHDHEAHQAFFAEHLVSKGREVAVACLDTLRSLASLDTQLKGFQPSPKPGSALA